jgi:hypothetical protein
MVIRKAKNMRRKKAPIKRPNETKKKAALASVGKKNMRYTFNSQKKKKLKPCFCFFFLIEKKGIVNEFHLFI